jgi:hypothetical protein
MPIQRKVTRSPDGKAGFVVEGLPHTYDEATAKRLQYMRTDGTDELDLPIGDLAELDMGDGTRTGSTSRLSRAERESANASESAAFAKNPSGRP